ncbi:MAG: hypothetical protein AB1297_07995 [bacterium]
MKKVLVFLLCSFSLFAVKLSLVPSNIEIEAYPGGIKSFSFSISNLTNAAVDCKLYAQDLTLTPEGEILYLPCGSGSFSNAGWIKFKEDKFSLKGKERKEITASAIIPREAEGCYTRRNLL